MSDQSRSVVDYVAGLRRLFRIDRWTSGDGPTDPDGEPTEPGAETDADGEPTEPGAETDADGGSTEPHEREVAPRRDRASVTPAALEEIDPDELETKADVQMLLGLTPTEFVMHLLNAHDGELEQQAFTDYTDWSPSTVSRVLQRLEEEGRVVRIRIGRTKTVYHPDRAPVRASDPRPRGDDMPVP